MSKKFILCLGLIGSFLDAARPGEEGYQEGQGAAQGGGGRRNGPTAEELRTQQEEEQAGKSPLKRRGWAKPRGRGGNQSGQQGDGSRGGPAQQGAGQRTGPSARGQGGDVLARQLATDADAAAQDEAISLGELPTRVSSAPVREQRSSAASAKVTLEEVQARVNEGAEQMMSRVQEFAPGDAEMSRLQDGFEELAEAGRRFKTSGRAPASLGKVARAATRVEEIVNDSGDTLKVTPARRQGFIEISNGKKAATVKDVTLAFVSEGVLAKILFPWRRYKLKKALKSITNEKLETLASDVEESVVEKKGDENTGFPQKPNNTRNAREMNQYYEKLKTYILKDIDYAVKAARFEGII